MRLFFGISTGLLLALAGVPTVYANEVDSARCLQSECRAHESAVQDGKHPYDDARVCFYIEQDGRQAVPMFIRNADGSLINGSDTDPSVPIANHRKFKGSSDSYCPGRHYVEDALAAGGWVEFCNDGWSSSRIEGEVLRAHLEAGDSPQTLTTTVCLMDGLACDARLTAHSVPE